jgi:hypothetical protein
MKHKVRIIPKEEILANRSNAYEFIDFDKQETLEEAIEKYVEENGNAYSMGIDDAFEAGAKWQAETMYSEEEVLKLILKSSKLPFANDEERIDWFEQLKNK